MLGRLRDGYLDCSDLSRADLKEMFTRILHIDFMSWNDFDAVLQRFDPGKHGLIRLEGVLNGLQRLCPLDTSHLLPMESQAATLSVLSLATLGLIEKCNAHGNITTVLEKLVLENKSDLISFHEFVRHCNYEDQYGLPLHQTNDYEDGNDTGQRNRKMLKEMQFIGDILYELSRIILERIQDFTNQSGFVAYLQVNLRESCLYVARSLQIYSIPEEQTTDQPEQNVSSHSLLSSIATLLISFLNFRRQSLRGHLVDPENRNVRFLKYSLSDSDVSVIMIGLEDSMINLLGLEQADACLRNVDSESLEAAEELMCEMLGMPVPLGSGRCLMRSQCVVEIFIRRFATERVSDLKRGGRQQRNRSNRDMKVDQMTSRLMENMRPTPPASPFHRTTKPAETSYVSSMRSVRETVHSMRERNHQQNPSSSSTVENDEEDIPVNSRPTYEKEDVIQNRLNTLILYLTALDLKARRRGKILREMLNLQKMANEIFRQKESNNLKGNLTAVAGDVFSRVKEIQRVFSEELQRGLEDKEFVEVTHDFILTSN